MLTSLSAVPLHHNKRKDRRSCLALWHLDLYVKSSLIYVCYVMPNINQSCEAHTC